MRFVLPLPLNRANARLHWRTLDRKRRAYFEVCDALYGVRRGISADICWSIPDAPPAPLPRAKIVATLYVKRKMDTDNLFGRLKWCADWLVSRGYIVDDGPDNLEWVAIPAQVIDHKEPRVTLTLESA